MFVGLDQEDAHAWHRFGDNALAAQCKVLARVDGCVAVHLSEAPLFIIVGIKPKHATRVGGMEGLCKGRGQ